VERHAVHEAHDDEEVVAALVDLVDRLDVRVVEKRRRARRYQDMSDVVRDLRAVHDEIAAAATAAKTKAIAVLPFANISPDRESDYFGDGLTEELIANLSRLKDVRDKKAKELKIDPGVLAPRHVLIAIASSRDLEVPAMREWQKHLIGDAFLKILSAQ